MAQEWNPAARGMSLWELMLTLALVSVLLGLAVPSFEDVVLDNRRAADVNMLVGSIQLARNESIKRARPVVLCKTRDPTTCAGEGVHWEHGWMVFANEDDDSPVVRDPDEPLLRAHQPAIAGTIRGNRGTFHFRPGFWRSTNGTITFCDRRGAAKARAVIISYTGRPRVSDTGPGRPLVCANPL